MKNEEIVKQYIGDLEHFILEGMGWPIKVQSQHKQLVKLVPALTIKNDRLELKATGKFKPELLAAFWKFKYDELDNKYDRFYKKVDEIVKEF